MPNKNSFILYHSFEEQLSMLTDEQAGRLMRAIFAYSARGEALGEDEDIAVKLCFSFISNQLKLDAEKYEQTCIARSENGKKGGRPKKAKKANGFSEKQTKAKKADNEYEYDYEYEYENDNEYENEYEYEDGYGKDNEQENENAASSCGSSQPTNQPSDIFSSDENTKTEYEPEVRLTEKQYSLLRDTYGDFEAHELMRLLSEYKRANNKSYNSDYHAIMSWVVKKRERLREKELQYASSLSGADFDSLIERA